MKQEHLTYMFAEHQLTVALLVVRTNTHCLVYASLGRHKQRLLSVARDDFKNLSQKSRVEYQLHHENPEDEDHTLLQIQQNFLAALEGSHQAQVPQEYLFGTKFEHQVWDQLTKVKSGQTITYGAVARRIGSPKACRAVGTAVGKNKLAIVIPCHRCVPSNGSIGKFRWGSRLKEQLTKREKNLGN